MPPASASDGSVMVRVWWWVRVAWWPIFLGFAAVIAGFTRDRACFDRYHLLPGLDNHPGLAWTVAISTSSLLLVGCVYACWSCNRRESRPPR